MMKKSVGTFCESRRDTHRETGKPLARVTPAIRTRLVRLAYRFLWNQADAEDTVHDALLTAESKADDLRDDQNWWSWICKIVVNRCFERGRQTGTRKRHEDNYKIHVMQRVGGDSGRDESQGGLDAIRTALVDLPRRQREVLVLLHMEGMSYDEIGRVLEISPSTARVHARAGRERLRKVMLGRHPDWFDCRKQAEASDS